MTAEVSTSRERRDRSANVCRHPASSAFYIERTMPLIRRGILKARDGDRKNTKRPFRSDPSVHLSCARLQRDCLTTAMDTASRPTITKGDDGEYDGEVPFGPFSVSPPQPILPFTSPPGSTPRSQECFRISRRDAHLVYHGEHLVYHGEHLDALRIGVLLSRGSPM